MRGGYARPALIPRYALLVAMLLMLSGCGLFLSTPPPDLASVLATEPVAPPAPVVGGPVAIPPEASIELPGASTKPAPRKPRPPHTRRRPPPPPQPPAPPPPPAPAPLVTTRAIEHGTFRTLLDAQVQRDGKVVGRAVDLVAGPDGKPTDIVVNLQGFMGIGDRKASFPWSTVRVSTQPKSPAITLVLGPHQLPAPDKPKAAGQVQTGPADATSTRLPMLDASVERPNGAKVGRVVDVLLGADAGPLAIVLDVSGTLQRRHTIAANWSALRFVTKDKTLRAQLDMTDQQVDASPPYANDKPIRAVTPAAPAASAASATPARGAQ